MIQEEKCILLCLSSPEVMGTNIFFIIYSIYFLFLLFSLLSFQTFQPASSRARYKLQNWFQKLNLGYSRTGDKQQIKVEKTRWLSSLWSVWKQRIIRPLDLPQQDTGQKQQLSNTHTDGDIEYVGLAFISYSYLTSKSAGKANPGTFRPRYLGPVHSLTDLYPPAK